VSTTNQPPIQSQPAGWFPQPDGTQRYWDGSKWTEHVAPGPAASPPPAPGGAGGASPIEPKKRNWFVRHKILTGLLVLLVIFIVAKAAGGGSTATPTVSTGVASSPAASSAASSAPAPAPAPAAPAAAGLNSPVSDGQFQFTVTKVECGHDTVGASPLMKTAQGQFCLVSVAVKNTGDKAQYLDAGSQRAYNAQGQQYSADGAAGMYLDKSNTFLNQINPGNSVNGTIVFDIPKDAKLAKLQLHDSPFSGGATVTP
jgi:hypothetical protein